MRTRHTNTNGNDTTTVPTHPHGSATLALRSGGGHTTSAIKLQVRVHRCVADAHASHLHGCTRRCV